MSLNLPVPEEAIDQIVDRVIDRLPKPENGNYLSIKSASIKYDIPKDTLRKWIARGKLKKYKIKGCVRVKVSELEETKLD